MSRIPVASTMPGAFYDRARINPGSPCYFTKREGRWQAMTFLQAFDFVRQTLAGLRKLEFKKGDVAIIFSENREEWTLTDYAIQWAGGATSAIYTTSSVEQIQYILEESEAVGIFCSNAALFSRLNQVTHKRFLKWCVVWDEIQKPVSPENLKILSKNEFLQSPISETEAKELLQTIRDDDLAILLYTSGTTGEPKGVMLTHHNVMSDIKSMLKAIQVVDEGKIGLSFLPLSHVYERLVHSGFLFAGVQTYFAESLDKLIDNLAETRPQVMSAVPRIFEKMYSRIQEKIKNASSLQKVIFKLAFSIGEKTYDFRMLKQPIPFPWNIFQTLADALVFRKIKAITGGRAEMFISGGAPLSAEIAQFFFSAGFNIMEGYGLSETCILSVNRPERFRFGTVGILFEGVEIKFSDDGEILARGPMVMKGYYKRAEENSQIITSDGWFHTGDIGEFDSDGFLKITDRKKDLIVLAAGKKVAPQPIENTLKSKPLLESVCLLGDQKNYIVALIVPNFEMCKGWGLRKGFQFKNLTECCGSPELVGYFQGIIDEVNLTLPRYSTIKYFQLLDKPFSIETGELTPTLKLKRRIIQQKYRNVIDAIYAAHEGVSSGTAG